ncbi:DEKNAAC103999 [Brettanomyces naardenensis]|uniref:DEKNAAC103999 n=1 Tax=Brettanomyces naardenensis TaxID=13370 RepID=A0A448YQ89_BRENA|nr:DEKNAAC103999 [Brettanomyces naardenensis]
MSNEANADSDDHIAAHEDSESSTPTTIPPLVPPHRHINSNSPLTLSKVRGRPQGEAPGATDSRGFSAYTPRSLGAPVPPPPRQRILSEYAPNSSERGAHHFQIKPVARIASRPVESPLIEEHQLLHKHEKGSSLSGLSEKSEVESSDEITFVTYQPHFKGLRQVWRCKMDPIGEGSFSKVYLTTDEKAAIKVTKVDDEDEDTRLRIQSSLVRELEILQEVSHPNIVQLLGYDSNLENNEVKMSMPYYRGGDLFSFVFENRPLLTAEHIRVIFSNIVSAVAYLHHHDICHRDIKLENVLLAYDAKEVLLKAGKELKSVAVLSDFGLSKKIDPQHPMLTTRCGSEDYVSPELLLSLKYDGKQNDCWSLGVLLYAILESRLPFDPPPNRRGRNSKSSHRIATISWGWYNLDGKDVDEQGNDCRDLKEVVEHLLVKRTRRWTIDEVEERLREP